MPKGLPDAPAAAINRQRDEYIANTVAAAEAQKALADLNAELKGGSKAASSAASDIKRYYDATLTDAEKYAAGLAEISALHASGAMDADLYARSVEELTLKFDPLGQLISGLADTVENELNVAFASVLNGTATLGDALLSFASNVLAKVAQDLFAQQFAAPIASGIKGLFSEDGNVFDQRGFVPFAKGGIVSGPTVFPFANGTGLMGEAGPEAIMPLSRGSDGKLGVAAANGNSAPKITINNYSGQEASTSSDNMGNIIVEIGRAIAQDITGGGPTYRAIKSTFGISNRLQQRG
jgi:lambda family phage tail tape measure protein